MKTIIHDFDNFEELTRLTAAAQTAAGTPQNDFYGNLCVVNANAKATHCQGCFKCWLKNRGFCAYGDVFAHAGKIMGTTSQCIVVSSLTYGGLSSSVKKFFDRSIGSSLPFFTLFKGETHHLKRYKTKKSFVYCFYGDATQNEKECARFYASRFCINAKSNLQQIEFVNSAEDAKNFVLNFLREQEQNQTEEQGSSK